MVPNSVGHFRHRQVPSLDRRTCGVSVARQIALAVAWPTRFHSGYRIRYDPASDHGPLSLLLCLDGRTVRWCHCDNNSQSGRAQQHRSRAYFPQFRWRLVGRSITALVLDMPAVPIGHLRRLLHLLPERAVDQAIMIRPYFSTQFCCTGCWQGLSAAERVTAMIFMISSSTGPEVYFDQTAISVTFSTDMVGREVLNS